MSRFSRVEYETRQAIDLAREDARKLRRSGHLREAEAAGACVKAGFEVIHLIKRLQAEENERTKVLIQRRKVRPYSVPSDSSNATEKEQ